ncbi:MAG: Mov34/MPN/PAD-1 family protein [Candidatus Diapherotrites archaeon]|nr:Mov34/MPN/PAD-1 family protein [Candidatus Diapherotrites archaeon]
MKKSVLEDMLLSAKNSYPREFISLLGGDLQGKKISEFVIPPAESGVNFSSVNLYAIPIDETIIGSIHSHPGNSALPSTADKKFFSRFLMNAIVCLPFGEENVAFYDSTGKKIRVEIVE